MMTAKDVRTYKERLLSLRRRLRSDVCQMAGWVLEKLRAEANGDLSYMPIHMADIARDDFERLFTLSLVESEYETLDPIEQALQRVEEGTYGLRAQCNAKIPGGSAQCGPLYSVLPEMCLAS